MEPVTTGMALAAAVQAGAQLINWLQNRSIANKTLTENERHNRFTEDLQSKQFSLEKLLGMSSLQEKQKEQKWVDDFRYYLGRP